MRLIDADVLETHEQLEPMGNGMYEYVQVVYKDDIDDAPTIEPERTGKWIEYDNSHCECPFCHVEWSYFDNEVEHFNYCPNCGARMEEPT